jgi:hypothetical protein
MESVCQSRMNTTKGPGQPHLNEEAMRRLDESIDELAQELERKASGSPPAGDANRQTP